MIRGYFPQDLPAEAGPFDAIVMLAVLEHFPAAQYQPLAEGCARLLKPGGRLIITVPSPAVDAILAVLVKLRLVHGMSLEEHHGYDVSETPKIFPAPKFRLVERSTFQLGLNNLYVFERTAEI
jgi:2-polyprenyl-3-methyl-5-hydroxy-6-metoxy-1,4-benzoquinol methylase